MAFVKGCAEILANPLEFAALLAVSGVFCRWRSRSILGRWLFVTAAMIAFIGASPMFGDFLLGPLEREYPPLQEQALAPGVGYIVVLGAGYAPHDGVPVTAALSPAGLTRVVEAIRLMHVLGIGKLVLSGGAPPGFAQSAIGYEKLARELGVPESSLAILAQSRDTAAEARAVRAALGDATFILVTSAAHMPRAMRLMQRVGAHAIPAPTGQLVTNTLPVWSKLVPTSGGLREVESALHEYLGQAAMMIGLE